MRIHQQAITTIMLAAVLAVSASTADAQSLPARIRAIRSARTPSDASAAYRAALRQDRTSLSAREAFVERLIALGKPAQAQSAARLLVAMDDDNAVGWWAILLTQVQREQFADAIETLRAHTDSLKDRDGIPASAGRLVAWYQEHRRTSPRAFALRRKVDVIRATFGEDQAYRTALHDEAAARTTQQQAAERPDAPARVEPTRATGANQPARLDEARARRESPQKDRSQASDARRLADRQDSTGEDRPQDKPLIGVDNPPLNSDDFNIAKGLQIGVSHAWGGSRVQGRLALDPQISNIFSGSVIGFRSVAAPGGRYVTLSGGGGTFSHGTIQMIAIPTFILLQPEVHRRRRPGGWADGDLTNRPAPVSNDPPSQPTRRPATSVNKSNDQPVPPWQREPHKSAREEIIRKRLLERSRPSRRSSSRSVTTSPQRTRRSRTGWGTSADSTESTWGNP